jgi:hypothetical protein
MFGCPALEASVGALQSDIELTFFIGTVFGKQENSDVAVAQQGGRA